MPKNPSPNYGKTPIDSVEHSDKRANIPTEELRGFVADDEKKPTKVLYPRDPSLDPQLVWQGKDEQDSQDLEVLAVPIYIQEKIHPHALIEDFRAQMGKKPDEEQLDIFAHAFEELDFSKQIEFYEHEQSWANRMILGDSLLVMNSLAEKERLRGKVQMIYLDPPYGIEFGSNWQVSTRKRDVKDGKLNDVSRQPEQIRAFRDTWEMGVHSYLAYLRDRLITARELLTETGSVFVQIGDKNVHLVRCLMDEVFGVENFQAQINFKSMGQLGQSGLAKTYDYLLWYSKNGDLTKFRPLFREQIFDGDPEYKFLDDWVNPDGYRVLQKNESLPQDYSGVFRRSTLTSSGYTPSCSFKFRFFGKQYSPFSNKSWRTNVDGMNRLVKANRIFTLGKNPYFKSKRPSDELSS
jgi:adenine-specific DNA-methyltransferase